MSPRARPLPPGANAIFSVQQARRLGIGDSRLRASDLDMRVYGMRAPAGASDDLETRCAIIAQRITNEAFFSGVTAARLMAIPLPRRLEEESTLDITVKAPDRAPHAKGIVGHSRLVESDDVRVTRGLRHSSPERTWCELAARLDLADLVAAGDHVIGRASSLTTLSRLRTRLDAGDRIGRPTRLREAIELLDARAESRPESLLRVAIHQYGLPVPEVNLPVADSSGRYAFRADLAYPVQRLIIEYQGDYHRERSQWRADMTRRGQLEALGWRVLEVNAADLARPTELCSRIRRILELLA